MSSQILSKLLGRRQLIPFFIIIRIPTSPSRTSTKNDIQEEERLLSEIVSRGEQSMSFQSKVLEMLAPVKATEKTAYADLAKKVMVGLHPLLWLQFQRECSNLLYTYQEKTAQLLHSVTQQQQQYPNKQQHQAQQQYFVHHYDAHQQSQAYCIPLTEDVSMGVCCYGRLDQ